MMRTATLILLTGVTMMLLGCGLFDGGQVVQEGEGGTAPAEFETPAGTLVSPVVSETPKGTVAPPVETKTPTGTVAPPVELERHTGTVTPPVELETPTGTVTPMVETKTPIGTVAPPTATITPTGTVTPPLSVPPPPYDGPKSLEERIFESSVIARVRLDSVSSSAESGTTRFGTKYIAVLEFNLSVEEYLKGSGADDIVAVWNSVPVFDTLQEAEDALPAIAAARDAQWDDREAIVFLQNSRAYLPSTQEVGRFFLSGKTNFDDNYSIGSRDRTLWLPAVAAVGDSSQSTGEQQRFLMDVPPETGTAPTITLGEIKTWIAAVTAKLAAGDGSEEYMECVQQTYRYEGEDRYSIETGGDGLFYRIPGQELGSGLAASSVVFETLAYGGLPNKRDELWLDGGDADLFRMELSEGVPHDYSGDGTNDSIQYTQRVVAARPLPSGVYRTHYNNRHVDFVPCEGYTFRHEWTVTVNAPAGTLHEAFFDPITDGRAVAADDSNGVLKPASFTDANGASATLERIAWEPGVGESGTVKLKLTPQDGIADHIIDFIALDGSVSLSLQVANATVDAANRTLSWTVASQPWENGDKLMLRIREDG